MISTQGLNKISAKKTDQKYMTLISRSNMRYLPQEFCSQLNLIENWLSSKTVEGNSKKHDYLDYQIIESMAKEKPNFREIYCLLDNSLNSTKTITIKKATRHINQFRENLGWSSWDRMLFNPSANNQLREGPYRSNLLESVRKQENRVR